MPGKSGKNSVNSLATIESIMRWYRVKIDKDGKVIGLELLERLDQKRVTRFGNKSSAKHAAMAIGLKTWRYVRF